jgi:hypothetical protein
MILAGQKERFAIEAEPDTEQDGRVFGGFRFWIAGNEVGDWMDTAYLNGCVQWLRDFESKPRDRFDPRLEDLDVLAVFELLWEPVYGENAIAEPRQQPIPYAYSRFHIGRLGMSSFDRVDILLVKSADGKERGFWRTFPDLQTLHAAVLDEDEMESVAREFCTKFEQIYPGTIAMAGKR